VVDRHADQEELTMNSRTALWTGRVLSGIAVLFLLFDGAIKLVPIQPVTDSLRELGYPATDSFARFLGVVTLLCTALYAWPRTALLGAVLLTAIMGGAIASHLRLGDPLFSHTLFGVYLGLLFWVGLWLRDERVRRAMPTLQ
jgi:DoxX-like family